MTRPITSHLNHGREAMEIYLQMGKGGASVKGLTALVWLREKLSSSGYRNLVEQPTDRQRYGQKEEQAGAELCEAQEKLGLARNCGRLPLNLNFRLSSILEKNMRLSSILKKIEVVFHFEKVEVVFHISSSWVKIRLHTKNQLPMLPRTTQIVMIPGVVRCLLSAALPLLRLRCLL